MAKFKATKLGFRGNSRVRPGQVFDAPADFECKWAERVEPESKPAKKKAPARKKTASKS